MQSCCGESTWKSQSKPTEGTDAVLPTERLPLLSPATRFRDSGLQIPFHQQYHVCRGYSFAEDSPAIRDSGWRNTYSDSLVLRWHHGHIFGNGSLNAESDKKIQILRFYKVQVPTKHWLRKTHKTPAWGGFAFLFTRNTARHSPCRTDAAKIYLHIMHIYAFAALTDIATIVYNNGTRRTDSPLNIGITWLCRTVHRILFSKLGERINIHFAVMRSILRNLYQKPSWTWHRTRLRSNTIYEFAAQFTNASYMVANRYRH